MSRKGKADELRRVMEVDGEAIGETTRLATQLTEARLAMTPDYEDLRDEARATKEDAIERLPELIEETKRTVEENGGTVYVADDAEDANEYIREVVTEADAETVVKSKSMTTEEIEVNDALEEEGVEAWETDLGEYVIQVAGDDPSHLIGPAMHLSAEDIAEIFNREFDEELTANPIELTAFARDRVGEKIENADVGMTGANFVAADTGSIVLVTNEGNARKTAVTPDTHIAVAGIEKIVPSVGDLDPFVELIAKTGTGQDITSYISVLTPPVDTPTVDFEANELGTGERDFHLVLLDNGRTEMREDPDLRETLYCIRCGACANTCANFQKLRAVPEKEKQEVQHQKEQRRPTEGILPEGDHVRGEKLTDTECSVRQLRLEILQAHAEPVQQGGDCRHHLPQVIGRHGQGHLPSGQAPIDRRRLRRHQQSDEQKGHNDDQDDRGDGAHGREHRMAAHPALPPLKRGVEESGQHDGPENGLEEGADQPQERDADQHEKTQKEGALEALFAHGALRTGLAGGPRACDVGDLVRSLTAIPVRSPQSSVPGGSRLESAGGR